MALIIINSVSIGIQGGTSYSSLQTVLPPVDQGDQRAYLFYSFKITD